MLNSKFILTNKILCGKWLYTTKLFYSSMIFFNFPGFLCYSFLFSSCISSTSVAQYCVSPSLETIRVSEKKNKFLSKNPNLSSSEYFLFRPCMNIGKVWFDYIIDRYFKSIERWGTIKSAKSEIIPA